VLQLLLITSNVTQLFHLISTGSTLCYNYYCRCCIKLFWIILIPLWDHWEIVWIKFWTINP